MSYESGGKSRSARGSSEEQSLLRYWRILRERVWVVILCTVLAVAAAAGYVKVAPKTYQAQAELEVQAASSGSTVLTALPILHQTGDPTEDVLTGASLVTTQPVAAAVIRAEGLDMSAGAALGAVQATPIGQAGLVAVQATASSPIVAKKLADGFVNQVIALSTARMHAAIQSELPTLQSQLAAVPVSQRYGPGTLGEQVDQLQQLVHQNDPTLVSVASATLPTAPSSPRTKVSLLAGLIGGLLVGVGAAFLFHSLDPRLRREEQLRERFGLLVLARVPRERRPRPRPLLLDELSPGGHEGYRTLRTVLAARARSSDSRAILITGTAPGEGKSTTALGLAAALAQGGARVVLMEADLRRPTFATTFGLDGDYVAIDQVLRGQIELSRALTRVKIERAQIHIVPARAYAQGVGLSFPVVRKLVEDARAIADFVIIDSAPLTAVIDALPFAQVADEVVIVSRLEHTRLNKLDELDDLLSQHGVRSTGAVLIGEDPQRRNTYYYASEDQRMAPGPAGRTAARERGAHDFPAGADDEPLSGRVMSD